MNHPFKLAAKRNAKSNQPAADSALDPDIVPDLDPVIDPDMDPKIDLRMSWDDPESAPADAVNAASKEQSSSAANSPQKDLRNHWCRQKRDRQARSPTKKCPEKNRFMHRLVGKLKQAGPVFQTAEKQPDSEANHAVDSGSHLADTQNGRETSPPMTFTYPPGSQPLPRHTIRRGIGVGGFGEVYFAVNDAGKEVAIKRIQRNLEIELRGASHCLNLKHPNLVSLYDIRQDENEQSWVIMEYVAGKNLRQVLDLSPSGLTNEEVHRWFTAICAGVSHLHSAGLVHRDLKPGNVFDDMGIVKVGDYGLSKFISASHRGGHTESVGTFHYMAPEIGRGQYGREIDIYALGIMLYELLTGRVPFDGESSHEIIVKHLTALPDLKGIEQPYRTVIAKCLEKDPAKRYQTVPEMMQALDRSIQGQSIQGQSIRGQSIQGQAIRGQASQDAAIGIVPAQLVGAPTAKPEPIEAAIVMESGSPPALAPVSEEPLARAIHSSLADLTLWWKSLDRSPGIKAVLLVVAGFVLLLNTHWLILILTLTGIFYVPYYVLRQMVLHVRQQPTYAEAQRIANSVALPKPSRPLSRRQWCQHMRTDLRAKPSLSRAAELNTSWIASFMTVFGLAIGAGAIGLRNGPVDAMSIAPYAWMGAVVLMSSLGLLGLGKLWERGDGEPLPRRFVLAGLGAGVGAGAYAINQHLMLPLDQGLLRDVDATDLPAALYENNIPLVGAMMAHFAMVFSVLRWWKPVDPLRRRRLSVWAVAVAVVAEWAVHQVLPIPQPAGMMIVGGTALAVQMSAPWINRRTVPQPDAYQPASQKQPTGARSLA